MSYQEHKDATRDAAKCIELSLEIETASPAKLRKIHDYLETRARRYGLLKEFRRDGYL